MQARSNEYPEVELLGTTWAVDEIRTSESPDLYEGIRIVDAFKPFAEIVNSDTRAADAIQASFEEKR